MLDFEHHNNPRVRKAYEIAKAAHKKQRDKAGVDYITHPIMVASNVGNDISAMIVALLHDVIEDHPKKYNRNILKHEVHLSIYETVALKLLTHDKHVPYFDYITTIKSNELAKKVKLADLQHNLDLKRLKNITPKDKRRLEKYSRAIAILSDMEKVNAD